MNAAPHPRPGFVWIFSALLLAATSLPVVAQEVPLQALNEQGTATTSLGTFSIEFYADRKNFPNLQEKPERPVSAEGRFDAPEGRSWVEVTADGRIKFEVAGFQDDIPGASRWLPVLTFTPKEKGNYKIGGLLKFWCDNTAEEGSVVFHVVSVTDGNMDGTLYEFLSMNNRETSLSEFPELQSLPITDAIGLTIWRNRPFHAAGGTITDLTIEKVP